jgi:hypothetical protein
VSAGGAGIPRLQDLSYIEIAAGGVAAGATFEQVRRALVGRGAEIAQENDTDGSFDDVKWAALRADNTKYVHNTVDVLKELMRLGWVERHILPSGPSSAYAHADSVFTMTPAGVAWAELVRQDRRSAYNVLLGSLVDAHPQFEGFLRIVGARPDSSGSFLTIPLLRPVRSEHPTDESYLDAFVDNARTAVAAGTVGWSLEPDRIDDGIRSYVRRTAVRMQARKKVISRKMLASICEEAITRVAFAAAGTPLDYISMELLRRWSRTLGVANFSYYAPGPYALRLWATAAVAGRGAEVSIRRSVGPDIRRTALRTLATEWQERRADAAAGMYLPIWQLRAAVCWRQRISDDEFDRAIGELLSGQHSDLHLNIHLDQASLRTTPGSTRPLVLPTASGLRRVFNVISVAPTAPTATTATKEIS